MGTQEGQVTDFKVKELVCQLLSYGFSQLKTHPSLTN
jgi:hypothetical protein